MKAVLAIAALCAAVAAIHAAAPAQPCTDEIRYTDCQLPNCRCSGSNNPLNMTTSEIPQLVFLTFDDAVTPSNYPFYKLLFTKERLNPNGHPITGTFYIAHEYTNYSMVNDLWRDGHEIALHSISHNAQTTYWRDLNESRWIEEVVRQRDQMAAFARIPATDIKGFRAPFLQTGGDTMYKVLADAKFQYECSRPTLAFRKPGMWPYTNDYLSNQECQIPPCPVGEYPGFWTVPMVDSVGDDGEGCSMFDTCTPIPDKQDTTFDLLMRNFNDQYDTNNEGNRSPFGIYIHAGWVNGSQDFDEVDQRRAGLEQFIDHILGLGNVYIVSVTRGVEWMKTPMTIDEAALFPAFEVVQKPDTCPRAYRCHYDPDETPFPTERYLDSCITCPPRYPWVGNHLGRVQ